MATKPTSTRTLLNNLGTLRTLSASGAVTFTSSPSTYYTHEKLYSTGHPIPRNNKGWSGDIGGPFYHYREDVQSSPQNCNIVVPSGINKGQRFVGPLHVRDGTTIATWISGDTLTEPDDSTVWAQGTTAIARCNPDNPAWSAAQFIGELREGLPHIAGRDFFKSRIGRVRAAGSEYLNVEFGWRPLVADITSAAKTVKNSRELIDKYRAIANKPVHRRYEFPDVSTTSTSTWATNTSPSGPSFIPGVFQGAGRGNIMKFKTTTTKTWFSGEFITALNTGNSQYDKLQRHYQEAEHLLGVAPTPDVLWALTPWSWLADWYTNTGDIMANVRAFAFDGMVMPYGYIMQEVRSETTYSLNYGNAFVDGSSYGGSCKVTTLMQKRLPATPFGFGFNMANLSARQSAILAACGISRA